MKQQLKLAGLAILLSVAAGQATAQEKIKIGVIVTLSGPAAALGAQVRDGFALGVKDLGGKMAGREVEIIAVDDELKPDGAVTKVKGLLERDKVEIVEETYMPLGSLDFQVELSKMASAKPDAVFTFMPGGMGVTLVKQYAQAGLADKIPVLSAFTVDESTLPAQQDAAVGMFGGSNWAPNLDNPQNKKFVAAYEAAHNSVPGTYAFQAYDAAKLIDSAVKAVKGDLSNKDAVAAALKKADFTSLRGGFKFNTNGYPIQNFYLTKVAKRPDGKFQTEIVEKVFESYGDRYAKECTPGN